MTIQEGSAILLRCEVEQPLYTALWNKDYEPIVMWQENFQHVNLNERFKFIGNAQRGDYAIELLNAQLSDSGKYRCQVTPRMLADTDSLEDFHVQTEITVVPVAPITPPQASSSTYDRSLQETNPDDVPLELITNASQKHSTQPGQLQARNIAPYWTRLTGGTKSGSSGSAGYITPSIPFVNPHPSASLASSFHHSSTRASVLGAGRYNPSKSILSGAVVMSWPYLVLLVAAALVATNVYLVCSLVRRYLSNRRQAGDSAQLPTPSKVSHDEAANSC